MPGSGYFPFGAGILLGLISLSLSIKTLLKAPFEKMPTVLTQPQEGPNWQSVVLTVVGMLLYVFLLNWLGFIVCTFLLIAFYVWVIGKHNWFVSFIAALSTAVASYLLFEILLDAQLPKGILEFFF